MSKELSCVGCVVFLVIYAVLYVIFGAITAYVIEWAWNLIVPLFHGPSISFAAACAIYVLLSLLVALFRSPQQGKS